MLGPIIRAEVGDTVKFVFRNMASHNHTMHLHGLRYSKDNEGVSGAGQIFWRQCCASWGDWTYTWEAPGKTF